MPTVNMPTALRRDPACKPEPFRIGPRALMIAGFAGLVLIGLSGAFLLGLAAVGVLAVLLAAFELVRRHLHRSRIAVLDQRTAG